MKYKQKGSALAVSLVLLTAITLISISSMQRSGLQTRIVANLQHHEILFQTTLNEQEYWWGELQKKDSRGTLIFQAQNEFVLDANNKKVYRSTNLDDGSNFNNGTSAITHSSGLLLIPPEVGELALSDGSEVNQNTPAKLRIASNANGGRPSLIANQLTGVTASVLNNTKHSL
jgi:hypothetical protein